MKSKNMIKMAVILLFVMAFGWNFLVVRMSPIDHQPNKLFDDKKEAETKPAPYSSPTVGSTEPDSQPQLVLPAGWQAMSVDDKIATPQGQQLLQQFQQAMDGQNATSIDYFGKVVDQNGNPVIGATVTGNVLLNSGLESTHYDSHGTVTDANGLFQFTGLHGMNIGISIQKAGYEIGGHGEGFKAPVNGPQSAVADPAIFTMWKLTGAEPLTHAKTDGRVPYDGKAAIFDLVTGKKSPGGDLRVTMTRSPLQVVRGVDHFDWNVQIDVIGGGLVEAVDAYKYLAPVTGYMPSFSFTQIKVDPKWMRSLTKSFYVRTAKGQYGRINIDLAADSTRPDTGISIETWMNPAGSRNLEFDPAKEIKPK